jgi:hypothetical protein
MLDSTEWAISLLGRWGFSAKAIVKRVKKYTGEEFSTSTIYKTLKSNEVRIKDYRDLKTRESQQVANQALGRQRTKKKKRSSSKNAA